jgi:N-acetylglutamate synthase-like GNAT family acetyltransferase
MIGLQMQIKSPQSANEFERYYQLRWEILRKPWDQPVGSEKDDQEAVSFHLMAIDEANECIGVARLQNNSATEGQVRFMAVRADQQGKGTGKKLLFEIESQARKTGILRIVLQARENALPFYESLGYTMVEKTFKLWDIIQHYRMEKKLD